MMQVTLRRWRPGLRVVSLIDLVRASASLSLPEAKRLVERFLAGSPVTLLVPDSAAKAEFVQAARALGAEGE